ncbi:c-type cytochrome [Litorimonas sp. WD9-15]|uniref:c-type cytochrome n=1 Tax=Litorimonas sp. WD9-15 TaxID=3418716 RepID=UPI003CFCB4D7
MTLLLRFALPLALLTTACSGSDSTSTPQTASTPATPVVTTPVTAMSLEERGAKIYKRCRACHTLDQDGRNKVGPNLWGIYGAKAGEKEGYAYSKAMLASNIVWDQETMDAYLKKPAEYVKGTKMSFIGLKKQEDRDAVQAYMLAETTP